MVVRNRLDLALVKTKCRFNESLTVTGGAAVNDLGIRRKYGMEFLHGANRRIKRRPVIIIIE